MENYLLKTTFFHEGGTMFFDTKPNVLNRHMTYRKLLTGSFHQQQQQLKEYFGLSRFFFDLDETIEHTQMHTQRFNVMAIVLALNESCGAE